MNLRIGNGLFASAAIGAAAAVISFSGAMAGGDASGPVNPAPAAASPAGPPGAPNSFADIVERVAPAVVSVDVEGRPGATQANLEGGDEEDGSNGLPPGFDFRQLQPQVPRDAPPARITGSGFFISADGYIVTNNHVVAAGDKITVRTKDERTLTARVIGRDEATDLAVIKVDGANFPFVSFEDRATPRVGDWVIAVGNPFNLGGTATAGIVSALARQNVSGSSYVDYMQIDAPINRGNSGGPTFDVNGRVVGVNTAIFSPTGGSVGIGFDIPADVADSVARQIIASGKVTRGYIGATVQNLTSEMADSVGLSGQKGALIADLTPGGPADKAGLRPGDVVLKVNGQAVTSSTDMTRRVALARPGDHIRLGVVRDGHPTEISILSGARPSEAVVARNALQDPSERRIEPASGPVLGMQLMPNKDGGLRVQGVARNSDAGQKGLRPGDIILGVNGQEARSSADVSAAAASARRAGRKAVLLLVARNGVKTFLPVSVEDDKAEEGGKG